MKSLIKRIAQSMLALAFFAGTSASSAALIVPDYGDTGWHQYSLSLPTGFSGTVMIGVSDAGDTSEDSELLVDNIQGIGFLNPSFESGDLTGYTSLGNASVVPTRTAHNGAVYLPTDGGNMLLLVADGTSTAAWGGTDGALVLQLVNAAPGSMLVFDFAFLARDYDPFKDFAFVSLQPLAGGARLDQQLAGIVAPVLTDTLNGQISGSVPEPATALLALVGLAEVLRRRRQATAG